MQALSPTATLARLQPLDAQTLATRSTVEGGGDADNVGYDAVAKQLYVAAVGGLSSTNIGDIVDL